MTGHPRLSIQWYGTDTEALSLSGLLGTSMSQLYVDGMREHVTPFLLESDFDALNGQAPANTIDVGDVMEGACEIEACPVAYAIMRSLNVDPMKLLLLERLRCSVRVPLHADEGFAQMRMSGQVMTLWAPLAAGIMWRSTAGSVPHSTLNVSAGRLPITGMTGAAGLPLREILRSDVLDRFDLVIETITMSDIKDMNGMLQPGPWRIGFANMPPPERIGDMHLRNGSEAT